MHSRLLAENLRYVVPTITISLTKWSTQGLKCNLELNLRLAKLTFRRGAQSIEDDHREVTAHAVVSTSPRTRERSNSIPALALRARIFYEVIPPHPRPRHSSLDVGIRTKLSGGDGCACRRKSLIAYSAAAHPTAPVSSRQKLSQHASSPLAEPRSSFITS